MSEDKRPTPMLNYYFIQANDLNVETNGKPNILNVAAMPRRENSMAALGENVGSLHYGYPTMRRSERGRGGVEGPSEEETREVDRRPGSPDEDLAVAEAYEEPSRYVLQNEVGLRLLLGRLSGRPISKIMKPPYPDYSTCYLPQFLLSISTPSLLPINPYPLTSNHVIIFSNI